MKYHVVSADDHIDLQWLPADVWQKRVPARYQDRAPRVVETDEGARWVCDGATWGVWGPPRVGADMRTGRRSALERGGAIEPGVLRPTTTELRLADLDRDGVDASVMYGPIVPLSIADPDLRRACYRAYNDWLSEFCATAPERLLGVGLLPIDSAQAAAEELRYLKEIGLSEGMFLAAQVETPLWQPDWEPLWEAGEETGVPLGFHLGGGLRTTYDSGPHLLNPANVAIRAACSTLQMDEPLAGIIYSGVLERHPGLKIVLAETGIGWLPYLLDRMDDGYRRLLDAGEFWNARGGLPIQALPSDYFKRQVWATFQIDPVGLRLLDVIGEDRVMWASDYPHGDSTWPFSRQVIAEQFGQVAPETRQRVLCDNARTLYGLD